MHTALKNRIKSIYLRGKIEALGTGLEEQDTLLASHTFQEDVKIVAWWIEAEIDMVSSTLPSDQVKTRAAVFLSRGAGQDYNARMAMVHAKWHSFLSTGASAPSTNPCVPIASLQVSLPGDCGIDMDDGGSLYLFGTLRNYIGQAMDLHGTGEIFYVER